MLHAALFVALLAQAPSEQTRIEVVDATTGKPVPHATVWIVDRERSWTAGARDPFVRADHWFEVLGYELEANANGHLVVPRDAPIARVAAGAASRWGSVSLPPHLPERILLPVVDAPDLELRLLGPNGKPTSIPASCGSIMRTRANDDGVAILPLATRFGNAATQSSWPHARLRASVPTTVTLDLVTSTPVQVAFDPMAPPAQIELLAPEHGEVVVHATNAAGDAIRSGYAHLRAIAPNGPRFLPGLTVSIVDGRARFPAVALDETLHLQVSDHHGGTTHAEFAGPTEAGQTVTHAAQAPPRGDGKPVHLITGRLVDANGQPMTHRAIRATLPSEPGATALVDKIQHGAFEIRLLHAPQPGQELLLTLNGNPRSHELDHYAVCALDAGSTTRLGDVRARPAELLVAGRVVDTLGRPVHAELDLSANVPKRRHGPALYGSTLRTDRLGRFALYCRKRPRQPVILSAHQFRDRTEPQFLKAGSTGAEFVVPAKEALRGRLMLAGTSASRLLTVQLTPSGKPPSGCDPFARPQSLPVAIDGTFTTARVAAGRYDLTVKLAGTFEVARIDGLAVEPGKPNRDPRLQAIDLIDSLRRVTVRLDAGARAIPRDATICLAAAASSSGDRAAFRQEVSGDASRYPLKLWLPKGAFVAFVRVGAVATDPVTITGDTVTVQLPE